LVEGARKVDGAVTIVFEDEWTPLDLNVML